MSHGTFVTSIHCMDGRVQIPVNEFLRKKYGVNYVDTITEPGPNKILADNTDTTIVNSIRKRVDISVNKHGSKVIAVSGHHDCAGNPVEKNMQVEHVKSAIKTIKTWNYSVTIFGLWIDENWNVSEII
jgi:hypothetical protein